MLTRMRPTAPTPIVRRAAPDEHDAIRALVGLAYGQYVADIPALAWDTYRSDLLDLDRHAGHGRLLVATVAGELSGYAAFYPDASAQGLGWPPGWAGGRGLAVHPSHRGHGVAAALMAAFERCARDAGAPVFAFHTSGFMTTAIALYERLGYRRAPEFDRDLKAHYRINGPCQWTALAYLKSLPSAKAA